MFLKCTFQRHLITSAEQLFCSAVLASVDAVNLYCDFLTIAYLHNAAVYNLVVLKHFVPWDIFWSGGIENFWTQNQKREVFELRKHFELYPFFMYDFWCQTVPIFSICILFTKIIETFWSRDVTDTWVLAHFEIKYFWTYQVFMC